MTLEPAAEALLSKALSSMPPGLIAYIRRIELSDLELRCKRAADAGVMPSDLHRL